MSTYAWSAVAIFVLWRFYLAIPQSIHYYRRPNGSIGTPFDPHWQKREIFFAAFLGSHTRGRLRTLFFITRHGRLLFIFARMAAQTIELLLKLFKVPHPGIFWQAMPFQSSRYPLGSTRTQWFLWCVRSAWWPWFSIEEVNTTIRRNQLGEYERRGKVCNASDMWGGSAFID